MTNAPILTPDLYLAMFGLFAATMVARSYLLVWRKRRARVRVTDLKRRPQGAPNGTLEAIPIDPSKDVGFSVRNGSFSGISGDSTSRLP